MECLALVSPGAPLWKAWVAAHWDRRLTRFDYQTANIKAVAGLAGEKLSTMSLAFAGYILLGVCRLLLWRGRQLEEDAHELRTALRVSVSFGGGLPSVQIVSEAALSLSCARFRSQRREPPAHAWDQFASYLDDPLALEGLDGPPLELLEEPGHLGASIPGAPGLEDLGLEGLAGLELESGARHVARLDQITLARAPATPLDRPHGAGDIFGAPSTRDRLAMDALSPQQGIDDLPPLDAFLGGAPDGFGGLQTPSAEGPLARPLAGDLSGRSGLPSGGLLPSADNSALLGPESAHSGTHLSGLARIFGGASPATPLRDTARILDFDTPRDEVRFEDSVGRGSNLQGVLESPGGEAAPRAFVATAETAAAAGSMPPPAAPPAKRRRRFDRGWDRRTEIPSEVYHNTAAITRSTMHQFDVFLPHVGQVQYTTTLSDIHPSLAVFFELAKDMGKRRRVAVSEASAAERLLRNAADAMDFAATPGAASSAAPAPPSVSASAAGGLLTPPASVEREARRSPSISALSPTAPDNVGRDHRQDTPERTDVDAGVAGSPTPPAPPRRTPSPEIERAPLEASPAISSAARRHEASQLHLAASIATAQEQGLRETFATSPDEAVSFLGLCYQPPCGAEAAAARFVAMLAGHMNGELNVRQDVPYGDILLTRGHAWGGGIEFGRTEASALALATG